MKIELCGIFEKDIWVKEDLMKKNWCSGYFLNNDMLRLCPLVKFCPRVQKIADGIKKIEEENLV
jgi:hypothetical protein